MKAEIKDMDLVLKIEVDLIASQVKEILDKARTTIKQYDNTQYENIVLDLKDINVIDSMGITFVVGLYKTSSSMGKEFRVTGLNKDINRLFKIMKLDRIFAVA